MYQFKKKKDYDGCVHLYNIGKNPFSDSKDTIHQINEFYNYSLEIVISPTHMAYFT